jgi:pimeloyl-ACP methyl ester carboxylesterase
MYHDLPAGLFRAGFEALTEWKGHTLQIPLFRIHGEKDQIIRCPSPGENVIVVKRAKHLVGQANPKIVNAAIERFITGVLRLD